MTNPQNFQLVKRLRQIATMAQKFLERLESNSASSSSHNENQKPKK